MAGYRWGCSKSGIDPGADCKIQQSITIEIRDRHSYAALQSREVESDGRTKSAVAAIQQNGGIRQSGQEVVGENYQIRVAVMVQIRSLQLNCAQRGCRYDRAARPESAVSFSGQDEE